MTPSPGDRVRPGTLLVSFTVPVSKNPKVPSVVLSDEIAVQFGPEVVYNTFEQNRVFLGVKQPLGRSWSFDLGYMLVYQQKASGYQYDLNHTLRWFFYYTPDLRKQKSTHEPASSEEYAGVNANASEATAMIGRAGAKAGRARLGAIGVPLVYAVGSILLGLTVPRLEAPFLPGLTPPISVGAATALLSAIASGTLPLTGLVFSLAFVMVQFSATAYSPRLVAWLAGSAMMGHSLGIFTATFIYSLAALSWIDRGGTGYVPLLTVWVAIALLLASVGFFVMLVEQLGMLQISRVLAYAGDKGRAVIERDYTSLDPDAPADASREDELPPAAQIIVHRGGPRVIQAIDLPRLVALAARHQAVIALAWAVGDTVVDGMPLVRVHGGAGPLPERRLRRLIGLGEERTFEQDPKYAIRILVDIAIKALSPAINDPTTAVQALDQVEDLLLRLGRVDLRAGRVRDGQGSLRVVFPVPDWEDFLVLAFDEIRYCGANSIQVMRRMRALLLDLKEHVPAERRPALQRYLERVDKGIRRSFEDGDDMKDALEEDRQGLGLSREKREA